MMRRPAKVLVTLLLLPLIVTSATDHADESTQDLLARVKTAYGLNQVPLLASLRQTGSTFSALQNASGEIVREFDASGRLSIAIEYDNGHRERRLLDSGVAQRDGQAVGEPMISAMQLQWARLQIPGIFVAPEASIKDLGKVTSPSGISLRTLSVDLGDSMQLIIAVDVKTARVVESAGTFKSHGSEMKFGAVYGDFRQVDGRLIPFLEHLYAMNRQSGYTQLQLVKIQKPRPPSASVTATAER